MSALDGVNGVPPQSACAHRVFVGLPVSGAAFGYSEGLAGVCGFKQDSRSRAASLWLPTKNIENNPMQSSRRAPARTLWGINT